MLSVQSLYVLPVILGVRGFSPGAPILSHTPDVQVCMLIGLAKLLKTIDPSLCRIVLVRGIAGRHGIDGPKGLFCAVSLN